MITDSQLQEAIERAEKATREPWCAIREWPDDDDVWRVQVGRRTDMYTPVAGDMHERNARFIAHARFDVPTFARELLRVRALARKLLDSGTLDDGEREIVEEMLLIVPPEPSRKAGNGP